MSATDRLNTVAFEGKLFSVRDLRFTAGGTAVCSARMSVSRKFDEEWHSVWFDVTAWQEAAETLAECQDRDEVIVRGRLDVSKPYTKRDGTTVDAAFAITADRVEVRQQAQPQGIYAPPAVDESVPF